MDIAAAFYFAYIPQKCKNVKKILENVLTFKRNMCYSRKCAIVES